MSATEIAPAYSIVTINGLKASELRGVAFLTAADGSLAAEAVFRARDASDVPSLRKQARTLRDRFDLWIEGGRNDKWFHGWPNDQQHKDCFTFKWNEKTVDQRLYGFLLNPMPSTNPRFQLCVLHTHDAKTSWNTEPSNLKLCLQLKGDAKVLTAIRSAFPDIRK